MLELEKWACTEKICFLVTLKRIYFFVLKTKRRLVLLLARLKVVFDRLIELRLSTRNEGTVRLSLERVGEIVKLGCFVWAGVMTWQIVCPSFIFDVSVCSALSFRVCKDLWFRVLFVLLVT